ncbi:MAG: helix-turn-helix transcriptional regulator [Oscillibacter sp.]|nr:helix-turn-helix transcriptional regulator [Oscillibacter sp.]
MNEIALKLRRMKKDLGLSNQELADLSMVLIGTVNRVLAGRVEMPNFQTIRDLTKALGGSLDDIAGFTAAPVPESEDPETSRPAEVPSQPPLSGPKQEMPVHSLSPDAIHAYDILLKERQKELETKELWLKRLFIACCVLVAGHCRYPDFRLDKPCCRLFSEISGGTGCPASFAPIICDEIATTFASFRIRPSTDRSYACVILISPPSHTENCGFCFEMSADLTACTSVPINIRANRPFKYGKYMHTRCAFYCQRPRGLG